jgi:hypothetical protein
VAKKLSCSLGRHEWTTRVEGRELQSVRRLEDVAGMPRGSPPGPRPSCANPLLTFLTATSSGGKDGRSHETGNVVLSSGRRGDRACTRHACERDHRCSSCPGNRPGTRCARRLALAPGLVSQEVEGSRLSAQASRRFDSGRVGSGGEGQPGGASSWGLAEVRLGSTFASARGPCARVTERMQPSTIVTPSPKLGSCGRPSGGPAPDRRPHAQNGSRPQRSHKKGLFILTALLSIGHPAPVHAARAHFTGGRG